MESLSHLNALQLHLSNERNRLATAKTQSEKELRAVWVRQLENEVAGEMAFLGQPQVESVEMTDDDLLAALAK